MSGSYYCVSESSISRPVTKAECHYVQVHQGKHLLPNSLIQLLAEFRSFQAVGWRQALHSWLVDFTIWLLASKWTRKKTGESVNAKGCAFYNLILKGTSQYICSYSIHQKQVIRSRQHTRGENSTKQEKPEGRVISHFRNSNNLPPLGFHS